MYLLRFLIEYYNIILLYYYSFILLKKGYKEVQKWREYEWKEVHRDLKRKYVAD